MADNQEKEKQMIHIWNLINSHLFEVFMWGIGIAIVWIIIKEVITMKAPLKGGILADPER